MFKKVLIAFVVSLLALSAKAQGTGEKIAERHLDKNRFQKAYTVLKKSILKDSTNVRVTYLLARYFFITANPDFNIDSAHAYLSKSLSLWNATSSSDKERYRRHELDSVRLQSLDAAIDSAAFRRAAKSNTVDALDHYLGHYPSRIFHDSAVILRDEAAFKFARQIGSAAAFEEYIKKYPRSKQRPEAVHRYEELLFKQETSDQQLSSYLAFLEKYPHTRFREEIEKNIFHLYTASGDERAFEQYIQKFPNTSGAQVAGEILLHLRENSVDSLTDSREYFLYPVLNKEGSFALVDPSGREVSHSLDKELPKNYRCGNIQDDILSFDNMLLLNNGTSIWTGEYDDYVDIGAGFVLVDTRNRMAILHKSNLNFFPDRYDDARLLNGKILAVKAGKWGLATLSGWKLLPFEWDDIKAIGDVLVLSKNGKISLTTIANITRTDGTSIKWMEGFDQVKRLPNDLISVNSGSYEGVLNSALEILVRLDKHEVIPHPLGFILHSANGFSFINNAGIESEVMDTVEIQEPWIAMKKSGQWTITDTKTLTPVASRYDSIQLLGTFAVGIQGDTMKVFSDRKSILTFPSATTLEFLPLQGGKGFLLVHDKEKKSVYTSDGTKLFTGTFDRIQTGATGYFVIQKKDRAKKDRKGLINSAGKEILPAEYDAIGGPVNGAVSLLKDRKFGQFFPAGKSLIKAEYDKNLQPYSRHVFTALKDGKFGLIDAKNKGYTKFEFDAIHYWQDSVALVSQNKSWKLLNFYTGRPVQSAFSEIRFLREDTEEKICRVKQGNSYGVISNKRGVVIPIRFTDLVNVGSPANPVFFTEKHVEEASLFVVIYYNRSGKLIRREVYEHDEYERIYCPN